MGSDGLGTGTGKKAVYDKAKKVYDDAQKALEAPAKTYLAAKKISDPLLATETTAKATYVNTQAVVKV